MNAQPPAKPPVMPLLDATHLRAALPPEMQALPQWVLWRHELREGRWTKVPLSPTKNGLWMAKSNDPGTWVGLEEALDAAEKHGVGIGFCFGSKDGLVGYDLDKIEENGGEEIASWFLESFGGKAYIETSPSGKGLRLFCKGSLPRAGKGTKAKWIEAYAHPSHRFLTVTGLTRAESSPTFGDCQEAIDAVHTRFFAKPPKVSKAPVMRGLPDLELLKKACDASNGAAFETLYQGRWQGRYPSQSEADAALCSMLSFWTSGDAGQIDRLFRGSSLFRPKWDTTHHSDGSTYGEETIRRAVAQTREFYTPLRHARTPNQKTSALLPPSQLLPPPQSPPLPQSSQPLRTAERSAPAPRPIERLGGGFRATEVDLVPILPQKPPSKPFPEMAFLPVIQAVQDRSQAPLVLCAQSVLAVMTLAAQHLADVEIPGIGGYSARRPISNYFVTIAMSGERKSSVDRIAMEGVERYQRQLEEGYKETHAAYKEAFWAYQKREKKASGKGGRFEDIGAEPVAPKEPILVVKEPTQEGLFRALSKGQLSQGLFNDEGGTFLGGYGLSKDHRMKTAASFNTLWDGKALDRPRAKEYEILRGRRFSSHLMIQPRSSDLLMEDGMLMDIGFTARCLVAEPESTIGERPFRTPDPSSVQVLELFHQQIQTMMAMAGEENAQGLEPRCLPLSSEAEPLWIRFYNTVERGLRHEYAPIIGFASKAPEHALRLAAVLALFDDPSTQVIPEGAMQGGIALANFYLHEQMRIKAGRPKPEEEDGQRLMDWLRSTWACEKISLPDICTCGPSSLRRKERAAAALEVAVKTGNLVLLQGRQEVKGKTRLQVWQVVPLEGKEQAPHEGTLSPQAPIPPEPSESLYLHEGGAKRKADPPRKGLLVLEVDPKPRGFCRIESFDDRAQETSGAFEESKGHEDESLAPSLALGEGVFLAQKARCLRDGSKV